MRSSFFHSGTNDGEDGVRMRHRGGNTFYAGFIAGQWNHIAIRVPSGASIVNEVALAAKILLDKSVGYLI